MKFVEWLTLQEKSYGPEDVPGYFYLCPTFNFRNENPLEQLVKRELIGVRGVTSSESFALGMLSTIPTGKNCLMKMYAPKLLEVNKLSRIMYDKPDYFLPNKLQSLKRVNAIENSPYFASFAGTMQQLLISVPGGQGVISRDALEDKKITNYDFQKAIGDDFFAKIPLKNVNDFANKFTNWLIRWLKEKGIPAKITYAQILLICQRFIKDNSVLYKNEQEWQIKKEYIRAEREIQKLSILRVPKETDIRFVEFVDYPGAVEGIVKESGIESIYRSVEIFKPEHNWRDEIKASL